MASSSSSQETELSNQRTSKSVNSSDSKRKRGKGESSVTAEAVLEAAAQIWDEDEVKTKKEKFSEKVYESPMFVVTPAMARMAKEHTDKLLADKKQKEAEYLAERDAKSTGDSIWTSNDSYGMAIVLGLICRRESLEPDACIEQEEAIDEL